MVRRLLLPQPMMSATRTLLDPFEVAGVGRATLPTLPNLANLANLAGVDEATEWFDRGALGFSISHVALMEELTEAPPWTPEPVDRRWRARGWTND